MKRLTRTEIIEHLRQALEEIAGEEHSICFVAAKKGIFCRGFSQWKFHELQEQYPQIVRTRKKLSRDELVDLADRWQLARQYVKDTELACDTQLGEGEFQTCRGWDEFTDEELAGFHAELCGERVEVVPAA